MDNNDTLSFPKSSESKKSSSKKSNTSKKSKEEPKIEIESEDISVSQLEMMANKRKLVKKNTTEPKTETKPVSEKEVSTVSSTSTVSSSTSKKEKVKEAFKENKNDYTRTQKAEFLYKLDKLNARNKSRSIKLDMSNTLDDIKNEYERVSNEIKTERSVAFFKRMLLLGVQGVEMLNTRFDPLGVDLDGWSEAMGYSLENQEYDEVMAELYEKYKGAGQMSPEVKLIFMIVSSATMFTISKKITKLDPANALKNIFGSVVGQQMEQQVHQPQQQYEENEHITYQTQTTEDPRPSKLKGPELNGDGIDINNILKTMNERKNERENMSSEDMFKSIPINTQKRGRGRPRKGNASLKL
jgi:hypothetical protein